MLELGRPSLQTAPDEYAKIEESRNLSVFPKIVDLLTANKHQKLLDYGGGDGSFLAQSSLGHIDMRAYYDICPEMNAIARLNLHKSVLFYEKVDSIPSNYFDAITMIAVWMEFPSEAVAINNLNIIKDKLTRSGRFYAAVTHPCFREVSFGTYETTFKNDNYLSNGFPFTVIVHDEYRASEFTDFHWNFEAMTQQMDAAGFHIRRIYEVADAGPRKRCGVSPWVVFDLDQS
jgi:hypothetical protein